jgi:hypothetical protein
MMRAAAAALLIGCADPHPAVDPRLQATELRAFTSADGGRTWELHPDAMARGFDSLGLSPRPGGGLWLTGHDHLADPPPWERLLGPPLRGFAYDGSRWSRHRWSMWGGSALAWIDPQWHGDELWHLSRLEDGAGDPVLGGGDNAIRRYPQGDTLYQAPRLADPMPVTFRGERHVFATQLGRGVVHLRGEPLVEQQRWAGVTVPFAWVAAEDELWLLGQAAIQGRRYPVRAISRDGSSFSAFAPLMTPPADGPRTCTSPVVGPLGDGRLVLLCVDEGRDQRPAAAP